MEPRHRTDPRRVRIRPGHGGPGSAGRDPDRRLRRGNGARGPHTPPRASARVRLGHAAARRRGRLRHAAAGLGAGRGDLLGTDRARMAGSREHRGRHAGIPHDATRRPGAVRGGGCHARCDRELRLRRGGRRGITMAGDHRGRRGPRGSGQVGAGPIQPVAVRGDGRANARVRAAALRHAGCGRGLPAHPTVTGPLGGVVVPARHRHRRRGDGCGRGRGRPCADARQAPPRCLDLGAIRSDVHRGGRGIHRRRRRAAGHARRLQVAALPGRRRRDPCRRHGRSPGHAARPHPSGRRPARNDRRPRPRRGPAARWCLEQGGGPVGGRGSVGAARGGRAGRIPDDRRVRGTVRPAGVRPRPARGGRAPAGSGGDGRPRGAGIAHRRARRSCGSRWWGAPWRT